MKKSVIEKLDQEWMDLIKEALDIGMSKEEIRSFLLNNHSGTSKEGGTKTS